MISQMFIILFNGAFKIEKRKIVKFEKRVITTEKYIFFPPN